MLQRILLGAAGWDQASWEEAFYPPDMPVEWRLAFYNTQFNCAFLSSDVWRAVASETLANWREETHEQFVFLLEGVGAAPPELADKALLLSRQDSRLLWFDRELDLKHLSRRIQGYAEAQTLYLVSADGDLGRIEQVRTLLELLGY